MKRMNDEMRNRLRRLGVVKGARELKPAPPLPTSNRQQRPLTQLLPGAELVETAVGACLVRDKVYPLGHEHGRFALRDMLTFAVSDAAAYVREPRLAGLHFQDALFLDTETTGLSGAGTLAFMVGVGFFEGNAFVVRQYFLRDHGDEPAMLHLLEALAASKSHLISFNGRSFDLPLLNDRYLLNRQPPPLADMLHLDLLPLARRLWRARLESCALSDLEKRLLDVRRTHEDVPGWRIPTIYLDYLRTGDARELLGVFYHNHEDMLSMVTLTTAVMRLISQLEEQPEPLDLLSLGRWQSDLGLVIVAEQTLRRAVQTDLSLEAFHIGLHRLGLLLKQNGRRDEAVVVWQQIAATCFDDVTAHVELAKYYEWHGYELNQALFWTEQALQLVASWRNRGVAHLTQQELAHRQQRLQRKLAQETDE